MGNLVKFKINGLSSALSNIYTRVTDLSRNELYSGETLVSDASGNVELDIGTAGSDGQGVIVYGDNYSTGNESTFKSFTGYGVVEGGVVPENPPQFTVVPQSVAVDEYQPAVFSALATGEGVVNYQWYKGENFSGSGDVYNILSASSTDNGKTIKVVVSDAHGSAESSATLNVTQYAYNFTGNHYVKTNTRLIDMNADKYFRFKMPTVLDGVSRTILAQSLSSTSSLREFQIYTSTSNRLTILYGGTNNTFDPNESFAGGAEIEITITGLNCEIKQNGRVIHNQVLLDGGAREPAALTRIGSRANGSEDSSLVFFKGYQYDVQINNVYLPLNNKALGADQVNSDGSTSTIQKFESQYFEVVNATPVTPEPVATNYDNVVVIGASIMNYSFGRNLVIPHKPSTSYLNIPNVNVYGYGWNGYSLDDGSDKLAEAISAFAGTRTLFIVHLGGNDVTDTRTYATMTTAEALRITNGFNKLYTTINPVLQDTVVADISFRDYDDTTITNEQNGSLPYNVNELNPRRLAKFTNSDGKSVMDLYGFIKANYTTMLSSDNVHLKGYTQETLLMQFMMDRIRYLVVGGSMPAPIV